MSQPANQGVGTLQLHDVSKAFGQVIALRSGSLTLYPGPIHDKTVVLGDPFKFNKENIDQFDFCVGCRWRCSVSASGRAPKPFQPPTRYEQEWRSR